MPDAALMRAENVFANEIRRAAEAAARVELPAVSAALWKAFAAGSVTEAEAEELSGLIEVRKAVPAAPRPAPARRGSRPRTDASLERRRRWAASGRLPPALAARFTTSEVAVLAVVAVEVLQKDDCRLAIGHLAALAGVGETTVRRALRAARDLGILTIEERRVSTWRNLPNVVRIVSPEWLSWMRLARRAGGGRQTPQGTHTEVLNLGKSRTVTPSQGLPERQGRNRRRGDPKTGTDGRTLPRSRSST